MKNVYLCGGIAGLTDAQCNDWRSFAKENLDKNKYTCLDPMRRDYRGREKDNVKEIVELDIKDINGSHIILVNASKPSWGTAMELFYAYSLTEGYAAGIYPHVITICDSENPSPWLIYHSHKMFKTLQEAVNYINSL